MSKTVLIVDDSESIREAVSFALEEAGHNVFKAINGVDALTYLDGREINAMITDLHMPLMNGIQLIRKVRTMEAYAKIPILFLTTESQQEMKLEAKAAGATGWVIKPFVPEKILAALAKLVR